MSEMGVPSNNGSVLESTSVATECASPAVKEVFETPQKAVTPQETPVAVASNPAATAEKKKKKKKKKSGYKSFLKNAMKGSSDKAKKAQYVARIQSNMGGGNFDKMADKL